MIHPRTLPPSLAGALLLLTLGPLRAQEAPAPAAPAPAQGKAAALDILADLLVEARSNKVLQARLLDDRIYYHDADPSFLRLRGALTDSGASLDLDWQSLDGERSRLRYGFSVAGVLTRLESLEGQGAFEGGSRCTIEGDEVTVVKVAEGKAAAEPEKTTWRREGQLGLDAPQGYEVLLRVSSDGSRWMAVAIPLGEGKSGKDHLAITSETRKRVYASAKAIPLNDDCTLPPTAR